MAGGKNAIAADVGSAEKVLAAGARLSPRRGRRAANRPIMFAYVAEDNFYSHRLFAVHRFGLIAPRRKGDDTVRYRAGGLVARLGAAAEGRRGPQFLLIALRGCERTRLRAGRDRRTG